MIDLARAEWRKSSRSNEANTGCVEISADLPGMIAVRDSKHPTGDPHVMPRAAFAVLLDDVKAGRYDL
ncbi:MAG: hypothetical protein JWL97_4191 [Gemmatimonadales bacterium]|jgi:hypothetical protein|nr:hypothetical protein [Gemmatimonadales bacterium]